MYQLVPATASVILALLLPVSALADMTGTTTLSANSAYNLNAGATPGCAGDIFWSGTSLAPDGTATLYSVPGAGGSAEFDTLTLATLQSLSYGVTGINNVAVNDVFAVKTTAGSYSKVLVTGMVTSLDGTSIALQYDTYGVTAGAPVVLRVMNNYSYANVIAQGSLFAIVGCGLATPGSQAVLQDATKGLPLTLNGASLSATVNGATTQPAIYYATATQIAAVLPSATQAGVGTFSVQFNGLTSNFATAGVGETAFGFDSFYETGIGPAVATDASYELVTLTHSASPGGAITFWGSGLGASPQDSDTTYTKTPHSISVPGLPLQVLIGGLPAQILYQGRNGYPGLDQINVMVPQSVSTGCAVSVVAINSNYQIISNFMTLPIATGGGACSDPLMGIGAQQIASLSAKSAVNVGLLTIGQQNGVFSYGAAQANFFTVPGSSLGAWLAGQNMGLGPRLSLGSCVEGPGYGNWLAWLLPPQLPTLDAGALTVTGPGGTTALPELSGTAGEYVASLPFEDGLWNPLTGGTFTFNGGGGKDVGAFTATLNFPIQENFTNLPAGTLPTEIPIGGQTITWTGGSAAEFVTILGNNPNGSFACNAPATAGQFTIPPSVLVPLRNAGSGGTLLIQVSTYPQPVSAPGLDAGYVFGFVVPQELNSVYYY
ncbi:MAG: hypothetical protein ABSF64_03325 [Bryobacteraceae bacterium]